MPETDHCPYCNGVLYDPPNCCEMMIREYDEDEQQRWAQLSKRTAELYENDDYYG